MRNIYARLEMLGDILALEEAATFKTALAEAEQAEAKAHTALDDATKVSDLMAVESAVAAARQRQEDVLRRESWFAGELAAFLGGSSPDPK